MTDTPTRLTAERLSHRAEESCHCLACEDVKALARELTTMRARAEAAERRLAEVREVTAAAYSDVRQRRPADDILNDIHAMVNADPQP